MKVAKISIVFTFLLAFAVCVSAQSNPYPNELKGYRFFGKGKLKELKPGVSTKQDVIKIFGENCEDVCDYNQNWIINFTYFDNVTKGGWGREKTYIPISKYLGKLYSISLRPKLKISFKKAVFPSHFKFSTGGSREDGVTIYNLAYTDKYGLEYLIFDEIKLTKYKNTFKWKRGDLLSIEYQIPVRLEKKMFIEQK